MPALPMKKENVLPESCKAALLIRSDIFIRIRKTFIPGGLTGLRQGKRTQDGELIILLPLPSWKAGLRTEKYTQIFWAPTIVR